jgi:hypothetical protein
MQKISDEINEVKKVLGMDTAEMAFVLKEDLQVYKMYERGKFNGTYSVKQDRLRAKLILITDLLEERILQLREAKKAIIAYRKSGLKQVKTNVKFHPHKKNGNATKTKSTDNAN